MNSSPSASLFKTKTKSIMVKGINDILFDHTSNAFLGDNYFIVKKVSRGKERNVDINILNSYDHHCREFRVDHLTFFF